VRQRETTLNNQDFEKWQLELLVDKYHPAVTAKLDNGSITTLDLEDWLRFADCSFFAHKGRHGVYVYIKGYLNEKYISGYLHRHIVACPAGSETHHLNGNTLDNRRENLQIVDPLSHKLFHQARRISHLTKTI
jgi:hypothetical protein